MDPTLVGAIVGALVGGLLTVTGSVATALISDKRSGRTSTEGLTWPPAPRP
jgi:hypothetical protein